MTDNNLQWACWAAATISAMAANSSGDSTSVGSAPFCLASSTRLTMAWESAATFFVVLGFDGHPALSAVSVARNVTVSLWGII
jgi:hypothetical protein